MALLNTSSRSLKQRPARMGVSLLGTIPPDPAHPTGYPRIKRGVDKRTQCWVCDGSGGKYGTCPECNGSGYDPRRPTRSDRVLFHGGQTDRPRTVRAWFCPVIGDAESIKIKLIQLGVQVPPHSADRGVLRRCTVTPTAFDNIISLWGISFTWGPEVED